MRPRQSMVEPNQSLYEHKPLDNYLSSASLERPTAVKSILTNFMRGVVGNVALGSDIESAALGNRTQGNVMWHNGINTMDAVLKNENRYSVRAAGFVSNLLGQVLTIAPLAGEAVGAEIAELGISGVSKVAQKVAPKIIEKRIPKLTLQGVANQSVGNFAAKTARYGLSFAGFTAPEHIEEAYDEKTNSFNWRKASIQIAADGSLGALIPSAQFLLGILGKRLGVPSIKLIPGNPELARLPEEHRKWVEEYMADPSDAKVHKKATDILNQEGYKTNAETDHAHIDLLTANDGHNLNRVLTDPFFADVPPHLKTASKDYILHNRLDELRANKEIGDGMRGWVDHIDEELGKRSERLAEAEKGVFTGIKEHMEFSQERIYKNLRKAQFEESHIAHTPHTIPDQVLEHIRVEKQIKKLEDKVKELGENRQTRKRIVELEKRQAKLLTPKEELEHIKSKFEEKHFNLSKEYHRLVELAHYWPQARRLLDRFNLETAHNAQTAYRNVLEAFSNIIRGNLAPLAKPSTVMDYLKTRLEQSEGKVVSEEIEEPRTKPKVEEKTEAKGEEKEAVSSQQESLIERSDSEDIKQQYETLKRKTEQFKKNDSALKNLVNCVLGSRNGEV